MDFLKGMTNAANAANNRLNGLDKAFPVQNTDEQALQSYLPKARQRAAVDPEFRQRFEQALAEYVVKQQGG